MPFRKTLPLAGLFAVFAAPQFSLHALAQITEIRGDVSSGDWYTCSVSGLHGMGKECGTKDDAMVFTATIVSIVPAPDDELRLTLNPETIFKGAPTAGMEIMTMQRRCLPEMKAGDSWLFSLSRVQGSKQLIVNYGSRSGPQADEGKQIVFLHRLAGLDHQGIVRGYAHLRREDKDGDEEQVPSKKHEIQVKRLADGREFRTFTDANGNFDFGPVDAGEYSLEPNTKPGLWTMWSGRFDVEAHGCTDFDLDFQTDGRISGRLVFPGGVDPSTWMVEASPAVDPDLVPASDWTDDAGNFVLHGLKPGRYIVRFEKTEKRKEFNLTADYYAPGTTNRGNAQIIELAPEASVQGIEIVIPRSAFNISPAPQ